jgi:hypothetical protein
MLAAPSADAAIVTIDLSSVGSPTTYDITGTNAGKTFNSTDTSVISFVPLGSLVVAFRTNYIGLDGSGNLSFAVDNLASNTNPSNFAPGDSIGAASAYSGSNNRTTFYYLPISGPAYTSSNFGSGSFMGFRFGTGSNYRYGYIEVLWNYDSATPGNSTFQLLSAAYESTLNTAITTPVSTPAPASVPEPSTGVMGLAGLVWAGLAGFQRRRAR